MRDRLVIESIEQGIQGLISGISAVIYLERGLDSSFWNQMGLMTLVTIFLVICIYWIKKSKVEAIENINENSS